MTTSNTETNPIDSFALRVLRVLYELAHQDRPAHAGALAAELGVPRTRAALALVQLDAAGLVSADRARLTMRGLLLGTRLPQVTLRAPGSRPSPMLVPGRALRGLHKVRVARAPSRIPVGWERAAGT